MSSITLSPIYSNFAETINGVPIIRTFGDNVKQWFLHKNDSLVFENARAFLTQKFVAEWLSFRLDILGATVLLLTAALVVHGDVDPGLAGLCLVSDLTMIIIITIFVYH